MKWLKIISLGVTIWGLSLIWVGFSHLLSSPVMLGLVAGFLLIAPAYYLGKYLGQQRNPYQSTSPSPTPSTRPAVVFARHHHSLPTRPMPAVQHLHSTPTRPMAITVTR